MRKQSGFTLIELMVVMAIIAILATAGLSAYGGYLKKARDATRIADIKAIESVVLASLGSIGLSPTLTQLRSALTEMNNGVLLEDPMKGKGNICLNGLLSIVVACNYEYHSCDQQNGYELRARFENYSNAEGKYARDEFDERLDYYAIGKCTTIDSGGGVI